MTTQQYARPAALYPATRQHGESKPTTQLPKKSGILPPVAITRSRRVKTQDENRGTSSHQPQRKQLTQKVHAGLTPIVPEPISHSGTSKKQVAAWKPVLQELTNIKGPTAEIAPGHTRDVHHQLCVKQGLARRAKPGIIIPVPTQVLDQIPARTRAQPMRPAPPADKALVKAPSALRVFSSKKQSNAFEGSCNSGATSAILGSGSIRKPSAVATSRRHESRPLPLVTPIQPQPDTLAQAKNHVRVVVGTTSAMPKVPPLRKHRMQATDTARLVLQTPQKATATKSIKDISAARDAVSRTRHGALIPAVPLLDASLFLDTDMEVVPLGDSDHQALVPDMDLDTMPDQEAYDPDPTLVSEYQGAIFAYKKEMEIKMLPDPQYMSRQSDLTWHYRVQLIEWLIQVHERFDLLQETLHLCVNYLDRFLSRIVIPVDQLQLAGTVALLLASKYEEIQSPAIEELVYLGGNAYTATRIRQAEIGMLQSLAYDMGAPGPMSFLRRISRADDYDVDIRTLAKYLVDVTLCDHRFIGLPSSMIAAVGYRASMRLLFRGEWTEMHEQYSGYTESALHAGINVLLTMLEQPNQTHQALFKKYQDERYMHSSTYVQVLCAQLHTFHY